MIFWKLDSRLSYLMLDYVKLQIMPYLVNIECSEINSSHSYPKPFIKLRVGDEHKITHLIFELNPNRH